MVKVLLCHHFKSQKIYCPKDEPFVTCIYGEILVVVVKLGIEVYNVTSDDRFLIKTKGQAHQVRFLTTENLIISLEDGTKSQDHNVHMYHITTEPSISSHCDITLPVLSSPTTTCITSDCHSNNIAVGNKERVTVHKVKKNGTPASPGKLQCCYTVAQLFTVNISFMVSGISICEEFILCRSENEVQVVAMPTNILLRECNSEKLQLAYLGSAANYLSSNLRKSYTGQCSKSKKVDHVNSGLKEAEFSSDVQQYNIVNDEHHISLFGEGSEEESEEVKTQWLTSIKSAYENLAQSTQHDEVITGPVQNHPRCAVFCSHIGDTVEGHIDKNVITHLYRNFHTTEVTQVQLTPVYRNSKGNVQSENSHPLISEKRQSLTLVLCYVSTATEGYLYSVGGQDKTALLRKYTYTTPMIQFSLSLEHLYVTTVTGLEVYTVESTARAIVKNSGAGVALKLFPDLSESCMIGLQPFLSVIGLSHSGDKVAVLSKSSSYGEEGLWSLYVLQTPQILELAIDMLDLADLHHSSSQGTYEYMLHQVYNQLWSYLSLLGRFQQSTPNSHHVFKKSEMEGKQMETKVDNEVKHTADEHSESDTGVEGYEVEVEYSNAESELMEGESESEVTFNEMAVTEFFKKVAFLLGKVYSESRNYSLCVPYFLQTELSLCDTITSCMNSHSTNQTNKISKEGSTGSPNSQAYISPSVGLWNYVDYNLFNCEIARRDKFSENLHQDSHVILDLFAQWRPWLLGKVILYSSLKDYKADYALEKLRKETTEMHTMDHLALVVLYLQLNMEDKAQEIVASLSQIHLKQLLNEHGIDILFTRNKPKTLTRLAKLLCEKQKDVCTAVLTPVIQRGVLDLSKIVNFPADVYINVLECLACDVANENLFPQIGTVLCDHYLDKLHSSTQLNQPVKYIIRRRSGLFKLRHDWLDFIHPLLGTEQLRSKCLGVDHCPCTACNAYLLKLQCLLCSDFLCRDIFTSLLEKSDISVNPLLQSVFLLCIKQTDIELFVKVLLEKYLGVVTKVLIQPWDTKLATLVVTEALQMQKNIQKQGRTVGKKERQKGKILLKDILSIVSEQMTPELFFSLLPKNGNRQFFMPFIKRSLQLQQADKMYQQLQNTVQSYV